MPRRRDAPPGSFVTRHVSRGLAPTTNWTSGKWGKEAEGATRLRDERLEQQPAGGRVFQEGDDEFAVVIEGGGASNQRQDAVGPGELEQTVDVLVVEPLRDSPQHELKCAFPGRNWARQFVLYSDSASPDSSSRASARDNTSAAISALSS